MSNILFCDTNIVRYILDDPARVDPFLRHVRHEGYILALSLIQAVELTKLPHYHASLAELIFSSDAHFFSWWKTVVEEEVDHYPATSDVDPLTHPSIPSHYPGPSGRADLTAALSGEDLSILWNEFENQKTRYKPVMEWLPSTLAPSPAASAVDIDFHMHNYGFVLGILRDVAPGFVESLKQDPESFSERAFPGAYIHAAYTYYRYVLKGYLPEPTDVPDIHQVFYVAYSTTAILEKSMAGILHQLRNERGLLGNVEIQSIRHVRSLLA
jgi:hypothetical protein